MNLGELKSPKIDSTGPRTRNTNQKQSGALQINLNLDQPQQTRTRYSSATAYVNPRLTETKKPKSNNKRGFFGFFVVHKFLSLFLILLVAGGSYYMVKLNELKKTGLNIGVFDPVKTAISAVSAPSERAIDKLSKTDGRTNFVVVGVDARNYNESLLTDSIMLVSYDHATNKVAQISFPRDLEAKYQINGRYYDTKLNAAFPLTYNETKSFDKAFQNLGSALENISGLDVHYGMMINFRGFKEIIDTLGGITVDVERSFTDYQYPNDNDTGLITVSFKQGVQTMNGTKALQFARSRHSMDNGEGSDFMRARRQQKVTAAIKDKFINSDLFNKADSLNQMVTTLGNNIKFYNIGGDQINIGIQSRDLLKNIGMYAMVIDPNFGSYTNHLLIGGDKGGSLGYAVTPNNAKDYSEVQELIAFYMKNTFLLEEKATPKLVWTDSKRYNDYVDAKKLFWESKLHFEFNDGNIRVSEPTPVVTGTSTPSPTSTASTNFGTIYVMAAGKDKSVEFYRKLFAENDMKMQVKQVAEMPKELERFKGDASFMIVID
jgi:LCP family protein required for cell wall assembly